MDVEENKRERVWEDWGNQEKEMGKDERSEASRKERKKEQEELEERGKGKGGHRNKDFSAGREASS